MLKNLQIKNYALIEALQMNPAGGLNIITGETGAGKSIMLGALGLLLGNRADTKVLFNETEKCVIEAVFEIETYHLQPFFSSENLDYDTTCIIRREISPQNKSRAFINDTPVNLDTLKKLGNRLMDIHSQHETLLLGSSGFQLSVVDAFAGVEAELQQYKEAFSRYKQVGKEYENALALNSGSKKELDYNQFLLHELSEAAFKEGEQEVLEEDLKLLENAEETKNRLNLALEMLETSESSAISILQQAGKTLTPLATLSKNLQSFSERMDSLLIDLKDIVAEIAFEEQKVELNDERLAAVQERLSLLYTLAQKHNVKTVEALIDIQHELEEKVQKVALLDEQVETLKIELAKSCQAVEQLGKVVSLKRQQVQAKIKKDTETLLREVGMPNATFEICIETTEPAASGMDKITFLFSANKGIAPQELKNAASGGELSRLMLCLKSIIADKTALPVIVFDEIDTGISGEIAIKVGKILQQMAKSHQIISISHLPQIAALGTSHYFVYKEETKEKSVSRIKKLTQEERIMSIATMIGGESPSQSAIQNAKELMEI